MSTLIVSLPDQELEDAMGEVPGVEFVRWDLRSDAPRQQIDIVVPAYWGGNKPIAKLEGLDVRLVQWQSIGYNGIAKYLPQGMKFANAASVHETSTAELAVLLTLAAQRGLPDFLRDSAAMVWDTRSTPSLADRRVLLVGYGGVAKATEARLAPFETQITRVASSARNESNLAGDTVSVRAIADLHECLAETDIVILAVPLTDATTRLIDAAALAALPDGALVVNVSRGPVVDTDALVAELQSGRLRAALDVTDPEPLPQGHPLWDCPNTIITPHVGGDSSAMLPRMVALLKRQIARMIAGEQPENIVLG